MKCGKIRLAPKSPKGDLNENYFFGYLILERANKMRQLSL